MNEVVKRQEIEKEMERLENEFNSYGISFETSSTENGLSVGIHWIKGFMAFGPETVELFAGKLMEAAQAVREFKYAGCRIAE